MSNVMYLIYPSATPQHRAALEYEWPENGERLAATGIRHKMDQTELCVPGNTYSQYLKYYSYIHKMEELPVRPLLWKRVSRCTFRRYIRENNLKE